MKVKVSYTVQRTEEVEVDDKFQQLTESGGWYDLTYKEQDTLTNELLETLTQVTPAQFFLELILQYFYVIDVAIQRSCFNIKDDGSKYSSIE